MGDDYNIDMKRIHILHNAFDIKTHSENFINYLEVVILEDGTIEYAVPSHQEKLIKLAIDKLGVDRNGVMHACPKEMYFDFNTWLMLVTGAVSVWTNFYMYPDDLNEKQMESLLKLKESGLYTGYLPKGDGNE